MSTNGAEEGGAAPTWTPFVLLAGVFAISFAAIFFKLAEPTHPLVSAGIRLVVAGLVLMPLVVRAYRRGDLRGRVLKAALGGGVLYSLHFGAWVSSLRYTTVAASVTLVTATPLLLAVHAVVTGRDRPDRKLWASLVLAAIGVTWIGGTDLGTSPTALFGDALALAGAAAIAAYMVVVRRLGEIDVWSFTGVAASVGGLILLIAAAAAGIPVEPASSEALFYLVLAALVPQLVGHSSLTWVLRHTTPTTVGIATLAEPVGSTALAWFILAESPEFGVLGGCTVVLVAVALALLSRRSRPA